MKSILSYIGGYLRHIDKILPILCVGLTVFSIFLTKTMTYDTMAAAIKREDVSFKTQVVAGVLGICVALVISLIDFKFIAKIWYVYAPAAVILQMLLFVPSLAIKRDDDSAWLRLGSFTIQPSEILKFAFILTVAAHISKLGDKINSPKHLLPLLAHGLFPVGLIIIQGDAGSALVFLFIFVCMLFMAGISWKYLVAGAVAVPPILYVAWNFVMKDHHRFRFLILFDEELQEAERRDRFYQQYNGRMALGSGQLRGLGFDADNYTYIPEGRNDYVFSYIGMTFGFIGCMIVVIVLAVLCLKLLSDASGAQDMLGRMICVGVFAMVLFHCIVNIGMVLCVTPVIGIPLPFISQGGTAMLMMHACIGLVLSVTAHREKAKHMFYTEKD